MAQAIDDYTTPHTCCCGASPPEETFLAFAYRSRTVARANTFSRLARRMLLAAIAMPAICMTFTVELASPQPPRPSELTKRAVSTAPIGLWATEVCVAHR